MVINIVLSFLLLLSFATDSGDRLPVYIQTDKDLNELSVEFMNKLKAQEPVDKIVAQFASLSQEEIIRQLRSDEEIIAFWLNIYNGFILKILRENPELYEDRRSFFKKPFIDIAGRTMSFADIEHGILRRSSFEYLLGYIKKPFAPEWEEKLAPSIKDYRIHFALNCGAKSCPPVNIYKPDIIDRQLTKMTENYLPRVTEFNKEENTVVTTPLMSWFRGDFGGKCGVKKILKEKKLIPDTDVHLKFGDYDWTLYLDNFVD